MLIFLFCNIFNFKNVTNYFYPQSPSDPLPVPLTKRKSLEILIFVTFLQNQNDTGLSLIFRQKLSFVTFVTRFWKNFYIIFIFRLFYIYITYKRELFKISIDFLKICVTSVTIQYKPYPVWKIRVTPEKSKMLQHFKNR